MLRLILLLIHEHGQVSKQVGLPLDLVLGHRVALSYDVGRLGFLVHDNLFTLSDKLEAILLYLGLAGQCMCTLIVWRLAHAH